MVDEDSEKKAKGPTEKEKESVRKRFTEMKAARVQTLHPKEQFAEEKRKKEKERKKEREATDAKIIAARESNPELYAAWQKKREKDLLHERLQQENEEILNRPVATWKDYTLRGLVFFTDGDLDQAYDEFYTAFSMNAQDIVSLSFLKAIREMYAQSQPVPIFDAKVLNSKKLEISPDYITYLFYNDLLYLYISLGKESGWFNDELLDWLPERFRNFAKTATMAIIEDVKPSPLLIKIANTIEEYSLHQREYTLNTDNWIFLMLSWLSSFLMKVGLNNETPNEVIARMVKIFLEYEESKHTHD